MLFTIYQHQIDALDSLEENKFIKRTVAFLKANYADWCKPKTDEDLKSFIYSMINFGKRFHFKDDRIFWELMMLEIECSMMSFYPFPKEYTRFFKNRKRDELAKIELLKDFITYQKNEKNG